MELVDVKGNYRDSILEIWKRYKDLPELNGEGSEYRQSPLVPAEIKKNVLVFVGRNK
jgi:hypothetical protein